MRLPTSIQETIVKQLIHLNPFFVKLYGVKAIRHCEDGRTIRLYTKNKGIVINIDITYNEASDLYDIKAVKLKQDDFTWEQTIFNQEGFTWEELDETIHQILHKHANIPLNYL